MVSGMLYREDLDDVRARMTAWWRGEDIGRPVMKITCPAKEPLEASPYMPPPAGWLTDMSSRDYDYRVYLSKIQPGLQQYFGEALPVVYPELAPGALALFLGCYGKEMPGTVWCQPCIDDSEAAVFRFDPDNFYWQFALRLGREQVRLAQGKFYVGFPDFEEGLDTLAAMRGGMRLLVDLHDRPDWVHRSLCAITDCYFHYYDIFYEMVHDELGGIQQWIWAPGRVAKFQCDFSAMIRPEMFGEFMVPVLTEMCERIPYSMYHWDGANAVRHHDHLLSIPGLDVLQVGPGGEADQGYPTDHPRWWPLIHKTLDAGKRAHIGCCSIENYIALKREFGNRLHRCIIDIMPLQTAEEAHRLLVIASE